MKNFKIKFSLIIFFLVAWVATSISANEGHKHAEESSAEDYSGVSLDIPKATQDLIGLKTAKVETSSIFEKVAVTGRISQNIDKTTEVFSSQDGIIKECPLSMGSIVSKDEVICVVENSAKERIEIKSPVAGVLMADLVRVGNKVDTIAPTHTIADLTQLYANFDIYEKDMGKVKKGQRVLVYSSAYADKVFEGKVVFVSPQVDEISFTIKIGAEIDNTELLLKPGMFVRAEIALEDDKAHLTVPSEAVQNLAGKMMVFLQDEAESFTATEVTVKLASKKQTLIEGDIKAGDSIVSDGAYIMKSKIMESEITGGCTDGH